MAKHKRAVLYSEEAVAATDTGDAVPGFGQMTKFAASVVATNYSGDLNITPKIQHSFDGTNWIDLVSFTALAGNSVETKFVSEFISTAVVIGSQLRVVATANSGTGEIDLVVTVYAKG